MIIRKTKNVALIALLSIVLALALPLAACGGGQADEGSSSGAGQAEQQGQDSTGESAEEQVARYIAGYDQISEENTLSNPSPLNYEYICSILGDEGAWLSYDDDTFDWVPYEGTPVPGEEIALEYTVEGVNGAILVMWSSGKDYTTDTFTSISNTLEQN